MTVYDWLTLLAFVVGFLLGVPAGMVWIAYGRAKVEHNRLGL